MSLNINPGLIDSLKKKNASIVFIMKALPLAPRDRPGVPSQRSSGGGGGEEDRPHAFASQSEPRNKKRKSKLSPGFRSFPEAATVSVTRSARAAAASFCCLQVGLREVILP